MELLYASMGPETTSIPPCNEPNPKSAGTRQIHFRGRNGICLIIFYMGGERKKLDSFVAVAVDGQMVAQGASGGLAEIDSSGPSPVC